MNHDLVRLLDGNTFVLSDETGDFDASPTIPTGLFSFDTRFLSKWILTINGEPMTPLTVEEIEYFKARFFVVPAIPRPFADSEVSAIRERIIGASFTERLTLVNHEPRPMTVTVRLNIASDFADLFEIKDVQHKKGTNRALIEENRLRLRYERESFQRETVVSSSRPARIDGQGLTYHLRLGPHEEWATDLHVQTLGQNGRDLRESLQGSKGRHQPEMSRDLDEWLALAPHLSSDDKPLEKTYRRCVADLAALRFAPLTGGGQSLPAAGLPWFMAIFGRDSILTSLQVLPFAPQFASTTLLLLSLSQGVVLDDFREEEPGKVPHELRYGETTGFEEQPHSPYYGAADTTPLFVILLDEYERWTGDGNTVRLMERPARAALNWISAYADIMGDGFIWYHRRNERSGLINQCWKDSWESISDRSGALPGYPRATCELQGYAYDAKLRGARLAREFWNDPAYANHLEREAADLKERFNREFWVSEGEFYALAIDGNGRQADVLSSNIGHLLWSGIVEESRAETQVKHLLGPRLYSGWGVRTLAEGERRYNPLGYHVGTVWPFDNSVIALGLYRNGYRREAAAIADGILDAAAYFEGRLPEAFGGYDRSMTKTPVEYPTACSPQAWSTGAPLLLLRTMLGMEPRGDNLVTRPALSKKYGQVELRNIPGRWGTADAFGRGRLD